MVEVEKKSERGWSKIEKKSKELIDEFATVSIIDMCTKSGIILTRNPLSGGNPGFLLHLVETLLPPSADKFISRNPMSELSELNFVPAE